jgi:hypothetical protein
LKKGLIAYRPLQMLSAVFMMFALLWLSISAPLVNAAKQQLEPLSQYELVDLPDTDDQTCNPFGNNTEEKAPNGSAGFSEEYLHHADDLIHAANLSLQHFRALAAREYVAFHGELLCPPPNHFA